MKSTLLLAVTLVALAADSSRQSEEKALPGGFLGKWKVVSVLNNDKPEPLSNDTTWDWEFREGQFLENAHGQIFHGRYTLYSTDPPGIDLEFSTAILRGNYVMNGDDLTVLLGTSFDPNFAAKGVKGTARPSRPGPEAATIKLRRVR